MVKQKCRQVINPKQTQDVNPVTYKGSTITFDKKHGYYFSMDSSMDKAVEYFTKELGYKLKILEPNTGKVSIDAKPKPKVEVKPKIEEKKQ